MLEDPKVDINHRRENKLDWKQHGQGTCSNKIKISILLETSSQKEKMTFFDAVELS